MNAKEAREIAYKINTDENLSWYAEIIKKIEVESKKGAYHIWWYNSINAHVRKKLIDEGYEVGETISDMRNGITTKISW